jgi:serine/threonine protein kinase
MIGKGNFGSVYLVKRKLTGKYYALKVMSKTTVADNNLAKYIYTERKIQSQINHPFITKLQCAFQTQTHICMVQDYCSGGDLSKIIQREKRLSEERARIYIAEILLALEELHNREIIYRDLKSENVVLDEEGHALLTDFGLSKEGVGSTSYTQSFCGSVAYLAPEMLKRTGHGRSVDWYLLGVLLYEMLVGIPPYFNSNRDKLFDNIKRGPLQVPRDMPPDALDLIVKLLNRNPRTRLGAGAGDAEEIKAHKFFKSLNWQDVLNRKLKPPRPKVKPIVEENIDLDIEKETEDKGRMERWTFIANNF